MWGYNKLTLGVLAKILIFFSVIGSTREKNKSRQGNLPVLAKIT
jgi:hypothetical protein